MRLRSRINFGKYKGRFVWEVLENNPSYLVWCLENTNSHPSVELVQALEAKGLRVTKLSGNRVVTGDNIKRVEAQKKMRGK